MSESREQVAELLKRVKGNHVCQVCGHRRGQHAMDLVGEHFCEQDGPSECTCENYVGVEAPSYAELVAGLEGVARALAACALAEAKLWGEPSESGMTRDHEYHVGFDSHCPLCVSDRLAALERAAGEKS